MRMFPCFLRGCVRPCILRSAHARQSRPFLRAVVFLGVLGLLICGLAACAPHGGDASSKAEAFTVRIRNGSAPIWGVHYEYSASGKALGGAQVVNTDASPLRQGETVTAEFGPRDFPNGAELSGFAIQLFVIDAEGGEFSCGKPISICADYGQTFELEITSDAAGQYHARRAEVRVPSR